jgi:diguanylate cyclase (GGDEF)-like protein/PAS domain S-box-containing protein
MEDKGDFTMPWDYEYYREIYETSPIGIELYDGNGFLLHVNPAGVKIFGIKEEKDVIGFQLFDDPNLPVDARERLKRGETVALTEPFDFDLVRSNNLYPTSKHGIIYLDILITALTRSTGRVRGYLVQLQDATEREIVKLQVEETRRELEDLVKARTEALVLANEQLQKELQERQRIALREREQRTLSDAIRDTVMALSSKLTFREVIGQVLAQIGKVVQYDAVILLTVDGEYINHVYSRGFDDNEESAFIYKENLSLQEYPNLVVAMAHKESVLIADTSQYVGWVLHEETQWIASNITTPIIYTDIVIGFINIYSRQVGYYTPKHVEILEIFAKQAAIAIRNARLYENMQHLAIVDELTGLYNRRGLYEVGTREVSRVQRFKRPLTAIFFDIDHFKQFNDKYSYEVGDRVLRFLAQTVRVHLRDVDIFARYGGEEFVALLPEIELEEAVVIAERLRAQIETRKLQVKGAFLSVTVSLGVAPLSVRPTYTDILSMPERALLDDLIDRAGGKLHEAKNSGRNCVAF